MIEPTASAKADALAKLAWSPVSDPRGVTYSLQIATENTTFAGIVLEKKGLTTAGYSLTDLEKLKSVSKNKPYYWRVKAIDNASNESSWSAPRSFYVGFVMPPWALYAGIGVGALLIFIFGFWLGKKTAYY